MEINSELLRKLESLSCLRIEAKEEAAYIKAIQSILDYVDILKEADVSSVDPLTHPFPLENHFREDEPVLTSEENIQDLLSCSPDTMYFQYKVPPVLKESE